MKRENIYNLQNEILIFDKQTEWLIEAIEIPESYRDELFILMEWKEPEEEMFEYDLTPHQLEVIGNWMGRDFESPLWIVQLGAYGR